uniref:glycerol-3-phosphate dehydrogenase n=1 Tax=Heterorhabditis bacteriophora TaxID=37862 RepID=A0A1I7WTE6_HETBA
MLKNESLKGALIYFDGQHNDARMNLAIVLTAIRHGAKCVNHVRVENLTKEANGKITGAHITGAEWDIKAKVVVNATGPFTDTIRLMADPETKPICAPSSGVHIVLPGYYRSVYIPFILFIKSPAVTVQEIRGYLSKDVSVRRGDVMSAWSGLRPLVRDPNRNDTKSLARNHIIERNPCVTPGLMLEGAHEWDPLLYIHLVQDYGMEVDVLLLYSTNILYLGTIIFTREEMQSARERFNKLDKDKKGHITVNLQVIFWTQLITNFKF